MRFRVVLVWMLLALLPVRGWATLAMQLPPAGNHGTLAAHAAQAPCHDMVATAASAEAAADEGATGSVGGSHAGCSMCDLCHGTAAFNAQINLSFALNQIARVQPVADADTGRALVGGLERPPRSVPL